MIRILPLIISLLILPASASAAFERYRPSTIAAVLEVHSDDPKIDHMYESGVEAFRLKVTFTGQKRPLTPAARRHILGWSKMTGKGQKVVDMFVHEVRVLEGKHEYWLPIQEQLLKPFLVEVEKDARVELFAVWVGYALHSPVFLIGEFNAER